MLAAFRPLRARLLAKRRVVTNGRPLFGLRAPSLLGVRTQTSSPTPRAVPLAPHTAALPSPLPLEFGPSLPGVTLAYHTFGTLNQAGTNAVLVGHSLTSNTRVDEWWGPLLGEGGALDTREYFVVCANYLGSPYGSSSPVRGPPGGAAYTGGWAGGRRAPPTRWDRTQLR